MEYSKFINEQIVNANNETGVVTFFDETNIAVSYLKEEKKYDQNIAFKNKFLRFVDQSLQALIDQEIENKNSLEAKQKAEELHNEQIMSVRRDKVNEYYKVIAVKNSQMQCLFGRDFIYPPYQEFMQKYGHLVRRYRTESLLLTYKEDYLYDYIN